MGTVGQRLLHEAIVRIGIEYVAATLHISPTAIEELRRGERKMDDATLLRLIDLIDTVSRTTP